MADHKGLFVLEAHSRDFFATFIASHQHSAGVCSRPIQGPIESWHCVRPKRPHLKSTMSKTATKTKILVDGLRYQSKVKGSPFSEVASFGTSTMSCFLCGKHRLRTSMTTRKLIGKSQAVCAPSCKAAREADELDAAAA